MGLKQRQRMFMFLHSSIRARERVCSIATLLRRALYGEVIQLLIRRLHSLTPVRLHHRTIVPSEFLVLRIASTTLRIAAATSSGASRFMLWPLWMMICLLLVERVATFA